MKSLQEWKNSVLGQKLDFDNASYDCVDVSKSWAMYLSDKPWQECAGWGNAKDIYANWYDTYLAKIPAGGAPQLGDIVVMNGNIGGGYGHTGVVVAVDGGNFTIYQQDTFKQCPVYTGTFSWQANYIGGWLRPKVAFATGEAPKEAWQRVVNVDTLFYRTAPNRAAALMTTSVITDGKLHNGDVMDFKGFVRGESVDGIDIWFVGRYSGGYAWAGGFSDSSTSGLEDLTPKQLAPNQRQVASDAMNVRSAALIAPENVVELIQPAAIIECKGYVHGQNVDGNDVWFVRSDGNYTWSGGYTDTTTHDLSDLTPKPVEPTTPTVPTTPTYPAATADPTVTVVANKKHPLVPLQYVPSDLVSVGNGQQLRKEAAASLVLMQAACSGLVPASGYRSYATQQQLYSNYVATDGQAAADTYSARPGYSEHQTGLTMDFAPILDTFAGSTQFAWLVANAHKYGWVLRYPSDKVAVTGYMYEPWHWRYVGVTIATDMHDKGIRTLEEYFNVAGGLYPEQEATTPTPTEPTTPTVPTTPTTSDEATKSATQFIARVTSQLAAAAVIVSGLAGLLTQYTALVIDGKLQGGATILVALAIVGYNQYKYKKSGGTKGWFF